MRRSKHRPAPPAPPWVWIRNGTAGCAVYRSRMSRDCRWSTRALWAGVDVRVLPAFDAAAVEEAAKDWGATLTTVVPTALTRFDPGLFRRIVVGGAAPPEQLPPNCVVSYGMTETGSAVSYDGQALPTAELRIVDGEIQVRGPMLLRAYRDGRDPEGRRRVVRDPRCGQLGRGGWAGGAR